MQLVTVNNGMLVVIVFQDAQVDRHSVANSKIDVICTKLEDDGTQNSRTMIIHQMS